MSRLLIVVAPDAGIAPEAVAAAWNADGEASAAGMARLEAAVGDDFFPGPVELVVIPLAVDPASSAGYGRVKKLAARLRPAGGDELRVKRAEAPTDRGEVIVVIRGGGGLP
jgi:hypothetical protein